MDSAAVGRKTQNVECVGQKNGGNGVGQGFGKNGVVGTLLIWGNHPFGLGIWAAIGIVCAISAPTFFLKHEQDEKRVNRWIAFAAILTGFSYVTGYFLRETVIMRERRRHWFLNAMGNYFALAITIAVEVNHNNTQDVMIGFMLVAVVIFAFMEIAKPAFDFELLQFFLRLPLQTAIICYGHHIVGWHGLATSLLVFGTIWNAFSMQVQQLMRQEPPVLPATKATNIVGAASVATTTTRASVGAESATDTVGAATGATTTARASAGAATD